jgi:hypothetical protein
MASRSGLKKRRALRARARQRPRADRLDLRGQYRESDLPLTSRIGVLTIEDPYSQAGRVGPDGNLDIAARLEPMRHADGTLSEGAPAWSPPRKPTMTVFTALRDDPIGRMFARRQVDIAQYQAARAYQQTADQATLGAMRTIDLSETRVSGGMAPDMLTPSKQSAMARLRRAEQRVTDRFGAEGMSLCRAVLTDGQSVETAARVRGAESDRDLRSWGWLFKRCLDCLALVFGFATSTRRTRPLNGHDGPEDPADDQARRADDAELADLGMRSGRANGRG